MEVPDIWPENIAAPRAGPACNPALAGATAHNAAAAAAAAAAASSAGVTGNGTANGATHDHNQQDAGTDIAPVDGTAQEAGLSDNLTAAEAAAAAALEVDRANLAAELQQFTPEVILAELLGPLFVHPSQLTMEGLLGEGAFATVHKAS
jgi:hypothetical protein